jgi:hypothetical protein
MKVDASGGVVWANLDADGPLALLAHAHLRLDDAGHAYLAAGTMSEMAVCKVDIDGSSAWTQTVAFGYGQAIALGGLDSSVYLVGGTTARLLQAPLTIPTQPTVLTYFDLTATSAYLGWSDNSSNETGFTVEHCVGTAGFCAATPGAWSVRTTTGVNVSTFNDTMLSPSTSYSWRVAAFNAAGSSVPTNGLSLTTLAAPAVPAAPTALTATGRKVRNSAEVRLAWIDNATDETGHVVERCTGSGRSVFARLATLSAGTTRLTDRAVSRATAYSYRVMATGPTGDSAYSNVASVTTP